ncbi:MAG: TolC family protein [Deltaproteobacteria bacterium]|nr:TolC family protein [Deltaproteobacteria bacterium]
MYDAARLARTSLVGLAALLLPSVGWALALPELIAGLPEVSAARAALEEAEAHRAAVRAWEPLALDARLLPGVALEGELGLTAGVDLRGARQQRAQSAEEAVASARAHLRRVEAEAGAALGEQLLDLGYCRARVSLLEEVVRWGDESASLARRRAEAGVEDAVEVSLVLAGASADAGALYRAQLEVEEAEAALRSRLQRAAGGSVPDVPLTCPLSPPPLGDTLARVGGAPAVVEAEATLRSAQAAARAARREVGPDLRVGPSLGLVGGEARWGAAVGLGLPFAGGERAEARAAAARVAGAEAALEAATREVEITVQTSLLRWEGARSRREALLPLQGELALAEERALSRYRAGQGDLYALLQVHQARLALETEVLDRCREQRRAVLHLEGALGAPLSP